MSGWWFVVLGIAVVASLYAVTGVFLKPHKARGASRGDDLDWLDAPEHALRKINAKALIPGAPAPRRGRKRSIRQFETKIAGLRFTNPDGSDRHEILSRCKLGEDVNLVREEKNPHDKNAIAVVRQNGERLGYLRREVAARLVDQVRTADLVGAELADYNGEDALLSIIFVPYECAEAIATAGGNVDMAGAA